MDLTMSKDFRENIPKLFVSCGGTVGSMLLLASLLQKGPSNDLGEILGAVLNVEGPVSEIVETCRQTNGILDLEGLIRHFASFEHNQKMEQLKLNLAKELPSSQVALAHTLLPLTILDGKYYYDCGDTYVEMVGLVQIGSAVGSPYAHLAGLIWLPDGGLHADILAEQASNGVAASGKEIERISFYDAPKLREGTIEGALKIFGTYKEPII